MKEECLPALNNHVEYNDNSNILKLNKTLDMLQLTESASPTNYINYLILNRASQQTKEATSLFLVENKFLDMSWEIILEDSSSLSNDISLIKILIKIEYINLSTLQKGSLSLSLDEKSFEEMLLEMKKIQKNF